MWLEEGEGVRGVREEREVVPTGNRFIARKAKHGCSGLVCQSIVSVLSICGELVYAEIQYKGGL